MFHRATLQAPGIDEMSHGLSGVPSVAADHRLRLWLRTAAIVRGPLRESADNRLMCDAVAGAGKWRAEPACIQGARIIHAVDMQ